MNAILAHVSYWSAVAGAAAACTALCVVARRYPGRWTVYVACGIGVVLAVDAVVYTLTLVVQGTWSARTSLPLALCNACVVVAAMACWWRVVALVELTYFWGLSGTIQGVITPDLNVSFPHLVFFEYVAGHLGVVTAALFLVVGLRIVPRPGAAPRVLAITVGYTAVVGLVDALTGADYMFLRAPPGEWTLLRLLGPWPWYLLSATAVAIVLFTVLDLPFWPGRRQSEAPRPQPVVVPDRTGSGNSRIDAGARLRPGRHHEFGVGSAATDRPDRTLRLHGWTDRAVVGVALAAFAAGFGQFGWSAALGDVARDFGQVAHGADIAARVGLSGTELGIGLAIIRLASLGSLPLIGLADRFGRRTMLLDTMVLGLVLTVASAASPSYWWFVALFACGRPMLSATNALAQVAAAELTSSRGRSSAVALTAAGYGVGAGVIAIIDSLASGPLGFRGMFALAVLPLALVPLLRRWIEEPDRFTVESTRAHHPPPVLGPVGPRLPSATGGGRPVGLCRLVHHRPGQQLRLPLRAERAAPAGHRHRGHGRRGRGGGPRRPAGRAIHGRPPRAATYRCPGHGGPGRIRRPGLRRVASCAGRRLHPWGAGRLGDRPPTRVAPGRAVPHLGAGIGGRLVGGGRSHRRRGRPGGLRRGGRRRRPIRPGRGGHVRPGGVGRRPVLAGARDPREGARGSVAGRTRGHLRCGGLTGRAGPAGP